MTRKRHLTRPASVALPAPPAPVALLMLPALFVLLGLLVLPGVAFARPAPDERQRNIDSFEYVWKTIRDTHFDPTFGGVDWQAVHDELRPRVEQAKDADEARAIMIDMISRLHQSHFAIIPAAVYDNIDGPARKGDRGGSTGLDIRVADGSAFVSSVEPGAPAARAGIERGWEVLSVDGEDIAPLIPPIEKEFAESPRKDLYLSYAVRNRLSGAVGDTVAAVFADPSGRSVEKRMVLEERPGKKVVFGNFPPFYLTYHADTLADGIGYFTFSCFFDPVTLMGAFGGAMRSFMRAPGIVIDLRGNPGGIGDMGRGMAGWFVEEKNVDMGTMRTRTGTLKLVVNPRTEVYRGPVAILVDGLSGSSSEIFAGGVQGLPRVRLFGSRTMGATLPSLAERLPNGDGFQYAFGSYISRAGVELEGRGVVPDEEAPLTRAALLEGRDPALEAAIDWIRSRQYKE
jgi:carboxyl-terminal processing protease